MWEGRAVQFAHSLRNAAGRGASNPFDAPAVDFEDEEARRAEGFFDEGVRSPDAAVPGAPRPNRTEGDDKYPWNLGFWMNFFDVDTKASACVRACVRF